MQENAAPKLQRVHAANVVNHVVVSLHRAFRRIDRSKVDSIAVVAMDQVVMHVEIVLVEAGGVCGAAARSAKRRRMKLQRAAGEVIVNVVPAHVTWLESVLK